MGVQSRSPGKYDRTVIYPHVKYSKTKQIVLDYLEADTRHLIQYLSSSTLKEHIVVADEVNRLDTVSAREYGTTEFWWVIAHVNGLFSWKEVVPGKILKIPSIIQLESYLQLIKSSKLGQAITIRS